MGRIILRWILPGLLAAVLLYYSLRGVQWGEVWHTIAGARWEFLLLAALITSVSCFFRALRWRILLNAAAHFDIMTVFAATMAGYLGNNFLPARAGEVVRSFIISSRSSLTATYVLTTALSERMMDAMALVLWSSVVLIGVHPKPDWLDKVSRTAAVAAGLGLLAIAVLPHTGNLCEAIIGRLPVPKGGRDKLLHFAEQILLGLKVFHDAGRLARFTGLTTVIWCMDAFAVMVGSRALDLHLSFPVASLLICGLGLGSALPSTPGYVGIYQFVGVSVLTPFGVSKNAAMAYVLLNQAMGYVVVLALGLPSLYKFRGWRDAVRAKQAD